MERTQLLARELDLPAIGADVVRHSRNNRAPSLWFIANRAVDSSISDPHAGQYLIITSSVQCTAPSQHRPYLQLDATLVDERLDVPLGVIIASADIDVGHRAGRFLSSKDLTKSSSRKLEKTFSTTSSIQFFAVMAVYEVRDAKRRL